MGEEFLAGGEAQRALSIFSQIIDMAPGNADAQAGQLRALIALGETGEAEVIYAGLPAALIKTPPMARVSSALDLAKEARPVGHQIGRASFRERVCQNVRNEGVTE